MGVGDDIVGMEVEAEVETRDPGINISQVNLLPRANATSANQIIQNWDFTSHFHEIYSIISPKQFKTKRSNS